jgi:hypothetical protein
MLHRRVEIEKQDFRKEPSHSKGKIPLLPDLTLPPTYLQSDIALNLDDYGKKGSVTIESAMPISELAGFVC